MQDDNAMVKKELIVTKAVHEKTASSNSKYHGEI
jgi:hypothetical protein